MPPSARSCRRKIRSTKPKSFARVAAYRRSKAASSPFATAAISQTSSAGVSIHCPQSRDSTSLLYTSKRHFLTRRIIACAEPVHQVGGGRPVDITRKPGPRGPGFDVLWQVTECCASGDGPDACAHQADTVEIGLFAGVFFGAFAGLIALVQQLDFLELFERLGQQALGVFELNPQFVGGTGQVFPPLDRSLGIGRIGEVR